MVMKEIYDNIGKIYDSTRKADKKILNGLVTRLLGDKHMKDLRVLDVGCGSGNYTIALKELGFNIEGLDISDTMLAHAKNKNGTITWHKGDATKLQFKDGEFDCIVSVLASHHMRDLESAIVELGRVVKKGGKLVLFTSTPELIDGFWLKHYVPGVVKVTSSSMTSLEKLQTYFTKAGFSKLNAMPFLIDNDLEDLFLGCGKYRPEIYLDPVVRDCISSFALYHDQEKLSEGLKQLEADIKSKKIDDIIKKYDTPNGDYTFVDVTKL
jgi:ubiquinone/menaquinone biosynthesis C-methylase UbiE